MSLIADKDSLRDGDRYLKSDCLAPDQESKNL